MMWFWSSRLCRKEIKWLPGFFIVTKQNAHNIWHWHIRMQFFSTPSWLSGVRNEARACRLCSVEVALFQMPLCPEKTSRCLLVAKGKTVWIFKIAARKAISLAANRRAITMTNLDLYNFPKQCGTCKSTVGKFKLLYISFAPAKFLTWHLAGRAIRHGQFPKSEIFRQTPRTCRQTRETTVKTPRLPHLEGYWPRSERWIPHHQSSTPPNNLALLLMFFWLVVEPTPLKNIGNLTQIRVKRKNTWNHQPVFYSQGIVFSAWWPRFASLMK